MYQKILILVLSFFIYDAGYSQSTSKIYIYDKEYGIPVEDANIAIKNGSGGVSDKNGLFEFSSPHPDTITVSHVSYETFTTVAGMKSVDTLFLYSRFYEIPPVSILPKQLKRIGITTYNKKHYGRLYAGQDMAQKFKLSGSPSKLLDVSFPVLEMEGADSILIKANFLDIVNGMPGKKINHHQVLFIVNQQKEISFDLSEYDLVMSEDFIFSMQIMKVYTNNAATSKTPYISIPVKINMTGEIISRTPRTSWDKKKGASLAINFLTGY